MLQYDYIRDEAFMGEPPPVLYIFGSTKDFHRLVISLLPFLKEENYIINNYDIEIHMNSDVSITMSNCNNNGINISSEGKDVSISLNIQNWTEIIIELVTLSLEASHSYLEYPWLENIGITVILETVS
jgi:hypothetical protein